MKVNLYMYDRSRDDRSRLVAVYDIYKNKVRRFSVKLSKYSDPSEVAINGKRYDKEPEEYLRALIRGSNAYLWAKEVKE